MAEKQLVEKERVWYGTAANFTAQAGAYSVGDKYCVDDGREYLRLLDGSWLLTGINGAAYVNPVVGPNAFARSVPFVNVTTFETYHFAAGANITFLTFTVLGDGLVAQVEGNIGLLILLDADSDAARDAAVNATGDPVEGVEVSGLYFCPVRKGEIEIPLRAALSKGTYGGGRVDIRSIDGSPLMVLMVAS